MARTLIIDSQPLYAERLTQILHNLGSRAQAMHFDRVEPALAAMRRDKKIDLIIIDLQVPGTDGFATIAELHRTRDNVPIVAVSALENSIAIKRAIAAGARGFIPRSLAAELVSSAIQLVLSGGVYLAPGILQEPTGPAELAESAAPYNYGSIPVAGPNGERIEQLPPRQREVLVD